MRIYSIQESLQLIEKHKKLFLVSLILVAVALNFLMFSYAYPDITKLEFGTTARDFSAYYMGAWRLFNNPTQVYHDGSLAGDYPLVGTPQPFKYMPSFLILMTPFLALNYMDALLAFSFLQLALIPLLAFVVYKLIKDKNPILGAIAAFIILVEPLPTPASNIPFTQQISLWVFNINAQSLAPSYYCGYVYINAHVLQAILLVGALYFGYTKKPWLSALLFAFGFMDPRAALIATPLMLWYNRGNLRTFILASAAFIAATNLPFFFYNDVGLTFLRTVLDANIIAQSYAYDWIPGYAVIALSVIELITIVYNKRKNGSRKLSPK